MINGFTLHEISTAPAASAEILEGKTDRQSLTDLKVDQTAVDE